ncbi:MAG: metal-sulfur cluster assembly factor [Gemmatimonadota bacterium]
MTVPAAGLPRDDLEEAVWAALARVQDPELPLGLVDLGLVYGVRVSDGAVEVDLTHTALGCPAIEMMQDDVEAALRALPGIVDVRVNTVWDPPWTKARLTPRGRMLLLTCGVGL